MSIDNRTVINDCEGNTGWSGDDTANAISTAGSFVEGSGGLATQLSNADEQMNTTRDSVGATTFSLDWSDTTVYLMVKDNLTNSYANGGMQFVVGDGTNVIGYDTGGNDAVGFPISLFFASYKMDISVHVASPGTSNAYSGSEASLSQSAITQIGYGSLHLAKAVGSTDNVIMDCFRYIANGSYALTINGGTSGTPEGMADVAGDDITSGWGIVNNPLGSQYGFFAPTEWGEATANADHYFEADGEQWFWVGDNSGGHVIGAGNFPFRLVANATDTGSWIVKNTVIVNTGARAPFDMSHIDFNTIEMSVCSFTGLGAISAPSSGGTSRFLISTVFSDCDQVTHNGADMSGCSVLTSNVAVDDGALLYDETADPDGEMDNMTFSKGAAAHHAIRFGTNVTASITLRGIDFTGFGSSDDANDSVFRFDATGGSLNLNLVGCTHDGSGFTVDDAAGVTVTVVVDPVTTLIHVNDNVGADLQNARVLLEASDALGDFPFDDTVTITHVTTTASVSHTAHGMKNNDWAVIRKADQGAYNGAFQISNVTANAYDYTMGSDPGTNATGTIKATGAIISGLTDVNGDISASRTFTSSTAVKGKVRKSTGSPRFKTFDLAGTIDNTNGLTVNVRLNLDE